MSLGLLLPMALSALAALLVPLLLHLARRGEVRPTDFAALRWLRARLRPRRRLRFEELPLLLARLLLLALLALWLAKPVLHGAPDHRPFVAVMPGVDHATRAGQPLPPDARTHWLAVGLPGLESPPPASPQPVASLLREIDASLAPGVPLIVLATARFQGADAQMPRLSHRVDWRIVAPAPAVPVATSRQPPRMHLQANAAHASSLRYLHAAARAWQSDARTLAEGDIPPANNAVIVRLVEGPLPPALLAWVERGGTVLASHDAILPRTVHPVPVAVDGDEAPLAEEGVLGRGRLLRFLQPLQAAATPALLEPEFPQHLRELLRPLRRAPAYADARAYAPVAGGRSYPQQPRDLQPWLALLVALLFALERWLATRARRGGAT